jgi:hypothetical protein
LVFNPKTSTHKFVEFDKSYGKMSCFEWYDDESLIIAFTTGQVVNASVNP